MSFLEEYSTFPAGFLSSFMPDIEISLRSFEPDIRPICERNDLRYKVDTAKGR